MQDSYFFSFRFFFLSFIVIVFNAIIIGIVIINVKASCCLLGGHGHVWQGGKQVQLTASFPDSPVGVGAEQKTNKQ